MKKLFVPLALVAMLGAGCSLITVNVANPVSTSTTNNKPVTTTTPQQLTTTITYYTSPKEYTDFCNGTDMDGVGYKKSLSTKSTKVVPGKLSTLDLIKATITAAANDSDFASSGSYTRIEYTTFQNGVVTLHPGGGWAGSSIFMCAWQPFVEKQLEQFLEVKSVRWDVES